MRVQKARARREPDGERSPARRTIDELLRDGVVVLDKPMGPTSHQVTSWVRDMMGASKGAHGGTLDPRATGVLPIGVGTAVRAMDSLHYGTKEYVGVMKMHGDVDMKRLEEVFAEFVGEIIQTPPVRSAVRRAPRTREVHSLKIEDVSGRNVLFRADCDAGTYIRSLCVDIGDALGTGAHLQDLRRTRAATMTEDIAVTLHDLKDALHDHARGESDALRTMLRPMEAVLEHMKTVEIKDSAVDAICHGADLAIPGIISLDDDVAKEDIVAIRSQSGEGVGLGKALMGTQEIIARSEGIAAKTTRVFMSAGTYDKGWTTAKR